MSTLQIELDQDQRAFEPGEEITGTVEWSTAKAPAAVELRLFWFTRGKGTQDAGVIKTERFEAPSANDRRPFRFRLPPTPYSCSGQLISIVWALELVSLPGKEVSRVEFEMGPGKQEIKLETVSPASTAARWITVRTR